LIRASQYKTQKHDYALRPVTNRNDHDYDQAK
jgi:hypothetical protein